VAFFITSCVVSSSYLTLKYPFPIRLRLLRSFKDRTWTLVDPDSLLLFSFSFFGVSRFDSSHPLSLSGPVHGFFSSP